MPSLSVGGLLFGDFYAVPSNHLPEGDGAAGLVLRRGYLTFDADFTENWFGRMRFELNQSGEFETYRFDATIKDLHLGWNIGRQKLLLGLSPTPTFDLIESIWGSRYLARTPMDLQGVPSRDTGFSLKGPINLRALCISLHDGYESRISAANLTTAKDGWGRSAGSLRQLDTGSLPGLRRAVRTQGPLDASRDLQVTRPDARLGYSVFKPGP